MATLIYLRKNHLALFAISLLFPYYAVQSRAVEYRGRVDASNRREPTLNGLAYIEHFNPDEYEALMWLRAQEGAPVVLEAVERNGGQYSSYSRVSANTGFPTLLGWVGHEYQWRGGGHPEPARRDQAGSAEQAHYQQKVAVVFGICVPTAVPSAVDLQAHANRIYLMSH